MKFLAFDQIELILDQIENMQIEFAVYREKAESVTPSEVLRKSVELAKADPVRRAQARELYLGLRENLREVAARFVLEDNKQAPPPADQTN